MMQCHYKRENMYLIKRYIPNQISKLLVAFILICAYGYSNYSLALSSKDPIEKNSFYAVLDVDKVVGQSLAYKEFKTRWSRVNDKYQKEIEFYESQLLELEKKITTGNSNKVDVVRAKKKIGMYEVKVQELLRKRKEVLEGAANKAIEILRTNIDKLVYNYAKQNKISVIFSRAQVIYFSDVVDVTDSILKKLNSNLRKLEVDIQ